MPPVTEFAAKQEMVTAWLAAHGRDAALLASSENQAWLACGGELRRCEASLGFVVGSGRTTLLAPADDVERLRQEELRGLGVEIIALRSGTKAALAEQARRLLPPSTRWTCDVAGLGFEVEPGFARLRAALLPPEAERLRKLGRDAAAAVEEVAAECFRGILECDAAARLAAECLRRQITPCSILAGADDRLLAYPRPAPKSASAEGSLLLGLVGVRGGLHVALTRTVCLSRPSPEFLARFARVAESVARLRHAARIGTTLGEAVRYAALAPGDCIGSLGGVAGYELVAVEADAATDWLLAEGQSLVWRVAIPGARCEDTFWLGSGGAELLTASEDWPRRSVRVGDATYAIPDLMLL